MCKNDPKLWVVLGRTESRGKVSCLCCIGPLVLRFLLSSPCLACWKVWDCRVVLYRFFFFCDSLLHCQARLAWLV